MKMSLELYISSSSFNSKDNVSFLCELNEDELIYNSSSDTGTINKESFKAVLEKFKKDKPEG